MSCLFLVAAEVADHVGEVLARAERGLVVLAVGPPRLSQTSR